MVTARVKKLLQTLTQQDNDTFYLKIVDMDLRTKFIECEVSTDCVTFALHTGIYFDDPNGEEIQKYMIFVNKNLIESSCVNVLGVIADDGEVVFINKTSKKPEDEEIVVCCLDITIAPMPFLEAFERLRSNNSLELCYWDVEWLIQAREAKTADRTKFIRDIQQEVEFGFIKEWEVRQ